MGDTNPFLISGIPAAGEDKGPDKVVPLLHKVHESASWNDSRRLYGSGTHLR